MDGYIHHIRSAVTRAVSHRSQRQERCKSNRIAVRRIGGARLTRLFVVTLGV